MNLEGDLINAAFANFQFKNSMDFSALLENLFASQNRVAIFLHENPDSDCVASAFALKNFLTSCKVDIYGKIFKNRFLWIEGIDEVKETVDTSIKYDYCFFLDTPTLKKTYEWKSALKIANASRTWIIDHHVATRNEFKEVKFPVVMVVEPNFSSTCEILWKLITEFSESKYSEGKNGKPITLSEKTVIMLLSGIYWETRRFKTSNQLTFKHISQMMEKYPSVTFEDIEQDMGKTMLRFEKYWSHCFLNSSRLLDDAKMLLIEVYWPHFRKHFFWFNGKDGLELYKKEKHYTYLLDKALSLRMNDGGSPIERAVVFFPSKYKPEGEITIMYETSQPHNSLQHKLLIELGFKCPKSDGRRYTFFGAQSRAIALAIVEEIVGIINEQQ